MRGEMNPIRPLPCLRAMLLASATCACVAACERTGGAQKEQQAEAAGFHVRYAESQKVLSIQHPDGHEDLVDITALGRVSLLHLRPRDSADGKAHYRWVFQDKSYKESFVPVHALDPREITPVLRAELPGFDEPAAQEMARQLLAGEASYCGVWVSEEMQKALGSGAPRGCKP